MPQMAKATDDGLTGTYSRPEVGFWEVVFRTMRPESRPDGTRKRRFNKRRVKNQLRLGIGEVGVRYPPVYSVRYGPPRRRGSSMNEGNPV
jgi:hypothetical protein